MAVVPGSLDCHYEGSDEASESDLLDQSLSVWTGWHHFENEMFAPIPLDIHTACSIGQYDCVRSLVQRGEEDINRRNKGGWTPLMYACYIGHDNIVHILLEAGVNVNVKNMKGHSPLILAASCGNESVAYFLLQAGAELEGRDRKGWTALFHATYSGHQNMVKFLLDNGVNSEAREPRGGFTPFMEAAAAGHEIIVQYFLHHGVDVNVKALSGHTARSLALDNGHTKIVSLIDNHMLGPSLPLRSDAGLSLEGDLSSSDDSNLRGRALGHRSARGKYKGPSIRDGPEAFNKVLEAKKRVTTKPSGDGDQPAYPSMPNTVVPRGYLTFASDEGSPQGGSPGQIRHRDVTSPISPEDHPLDSSSSRECTEVEDEASPFTKTGALTIKSSSGSSGGLIAALGLSRNNSVDESDDKSSDNDGLSMGLHRSLSDSVLKGLVSDVNNQGLVSDIKNHGPNNSTKQAQVFDSIPVISPNTQRENPVPQYGGYNQFGGNIFTTPPPGFYPLQGQPPQELPMSMLQHPLWEQYGYHNVPMTTAAHQNQPPGSYHSNQPPPISNPPPPRSPKPESMTPDPKGTGRVGLTPAAASEQRQIVENRPKDLPALLEELALGKYLMTFEEQDVDLQVFLSLTDNDLKEVGIKLFGPRRKMTNAIARWHSNARPSRNDLEQAYADKLEADMQEMAIQLKLAKEEVAALKLQVQQEHELRAVTESCLVKDRVTWQHVMQLSGDAQHRCNDLHHGITMLRQCHLELAKRVGAGPQACLTGSGTKDSLAAALKQGLSLEENRQPIPAEITNMSSQQLVRQVERISHDMEEMVAMATRNISQVLDSSPSPLPGYS